MTETNILSISSPHILELAKKFWSLHLFYQKIVHTQISVIFFFFVFNESAFLGEKKYHQLFLNPFLCCCFQWLFDMKETAGEGDASNTNILVDI